jgi:hypothetical protein
MGTFTRWELEELMTKLSHAQPCEKHPEQAPEVCDACEDTLCPTCKPLGCTCQRDD